jgi:hypothetical protein
MASPQPSLVKVIIPADTLVSPNVIISGDLPHYVSSGTRVKLGSGIFILVEDWFPTHALSQLLSLEFFRCKSNRRMILPSNTSIRYHTIPVLLNDTLDIELPDGFRIVLPAQTKLQQEGDAGVHLTLTNSCVGNLLSYDDILTEAKVKQSNTLTPVEAVA